MVERTDLNEQKQKLVAWNDVSHCHPTRGLHKSIA